MTKLYDLLKESAPLYPSITYEKNGVLSTKIGQVLLKADPSVADGRELSMHFRSTFTSDLALIAENEDAITKSFRTHFGIYYNAPKWDIGLHKSKILWATGHPGKSEDWMFVRFQQFADDVSKLMYKSRYKESHK